MAGDYDAIVIGSGFGGGAAACRMAEAGMHVAILERGRRWCPGLLTGCGRPRVPRRSVFVAEGLTGCRARCTFESKADAGRLPGFSQHR